METSDRIVKTAIFILMALVRVCFEWQVNNNFEFDSWASKLNEQLSKIGLGYIWHDVSVKTVSGICKKN
jgi:hypothetical protein